MSRCPGCGVTLPDQRLTPHDRYHASGECWLLYGELSAYNLSRGDPNFTHQLAVDAYGAQHSGPETAAITTAFALIGLCLAVEHGFTGRHVQKAHMGLARHRRPWPRLERSNQAWTYTVGDVLRAAPGDRRDAMLRTWAQDVWSGWAAHHGWVGDVCTQWLRNA